MLTEQIIKRRQYLGKWESLVDITDSETSRIYHEILVSAEYPSDEILTPLISKAKQRIQQQLEIEDNDLNLTIDEDKLLEYYQRVKRDIILRIRLYPEMTLAQAKDYISDKYADSPFVFDRLYEIWLEITGCSNWEEFKQFCVNKKFEGID